MRIGKWFWAENFKGFTVRNIWQWRSKPKWRQRIFDRLSEVAQSYSLRPHGLWPIRLLCPWYFPGKNVGVDCHFLLQGIFLTQESNPGLLHCRQMLYHLSHYFKMHPTWDFPGGPVAKTSIPNTGGQGLIPDQGTRSHMLQLRPSQINKYIKNNKMNPTGKKPSPVGSRMYLELTYISFQVLYYLGSSVLREWGPGHCECRESQGCPRKWKQNVLDLGVGTVSGLQDPFYKNLFGGWALPILAVLDQGWRTMSA